MLIFFFIFLVADGYLWLAVRAAIKKCSPGIQILTGVLFWLPVALIISLTVYGFIVPFLEWNLPLRTYLQSVILTIFIAGFFPILMLLTADFIRMMMFAKEYTMGRKPVSLKSIPRVRALFTIGWIVGALIFIILTTGTFVWQFDFKIREQKITLNELPPAFDGLKIVQFSDVHLGSWGSKNRLQEAMDKINNLHPDVIFFTGDMFNYCTADGKGFENILKTLRAPLGIYAIMGNHDYGDYISWPSAEAKKQNLEDLKSYYSYLGWKLLLNSHDILRRGNDSIAVIGVDNWGETHRFQKLGNIGHAQQGTEKINIQLLLSHDPSHWERVISKNYQQIDITFSGHTHGGQIGIDCCNIHWSPIIWISKLWCGLYQNPDSDTPQYLYVNQGLGNIGYSGRIGILPEITLIRLSRNK
ncbi:MAG: metallophosphoesterase [Bacteroidetes bacterium]|nr:metallophosphoesterase [Bacteroidota bacterium]